METKPLRQFDDLQQEEMSCEQLEKVLKYQMRSASFMLGSLAITQIIYLTINPQIFLQNDRYACMISQIMIFVLGLYGVYFSFGQLDKVVKTQSTYYKEKHTKLLVSVMVANMIMASLLTAYCFYASTSALANKSLQIAQNPTISASIYPQYISLFDSKELATFTLLSMVQVICFAYMCHIYWLFCDTSEVEQFLCEFLSFIALILVLFLLENTSKSLKLRNIDLPVDKNQLQPLFAGGIFIAICLIFVLLQRNLNFIDVFKSQIWRFTMGVVLMVCAYVIVSLNGLISRQYVENIGIFTDQCARYIDLAQEDALISSGCPYKYYQNQESPIYPQNPQNSTCMQLFKWEQWPKQQFLCVNTNCCQFLNNYYMGPLKNVILLSYILITLLTSLIGILFHIRRTEIEAPDSKLRLGFLAVVLVFSVCIYLFSGDQQQPHRPILTNMSNNPDSYLFKPQHHPEFKQQYQTNFEAFGCNPMTIDQSLSLQLLKTQYIQLNLTLDQGTFLVLDYNEPQIIFLFGCEESQQVNDCLSIVGNGSKVLQSLESVKLCLTSVEPQLQWNTNATRRFLQQTVTQQNPNLQNQEVLSRYLSFINVTVNSKANHAVDLYNSLILDCSYNIEQVPYFMRQKTNSSGVGVFYNYPAGEYGTTVTHDKVAVCDVFQTSSNINLQPIFPQLKVLTFFAIWDIEVDMDLMVFFKFEDHFCLVGSKASKECGYVWAGIDSTKSQTGETISFHSMGQYDYVVFVRSPSFKGSLTVQVYLQEHVYPIRTIHVDQAQQQSDVWVAACITQGAQLKIQNKFYFDGVIPNNFCS